MADDKRELQIEFDHEIYPRRALVDAAAAYSELCDVRITQKTEMTSTVRISVSSTDSEKTREIMLGFCNYALDVSAQLQLQGDLV